jgi:hypothetical protein
MTSILLNLSFSQVAREMTDPETMAGFLNELAYQTGEGPPTAHWMKDFREALDESAVKFLHDLIHATRELGSA